MYHPQGVPAGPAAASPPFQQQHQSSSSSSSSSRHHHRGRRGGGSSNATGSSSNPLPSSSSSSSAARHADAENPATGSPHRRGPGKRGGGGRARYTSNNSANVPSNNAPPSNGAPGGINGSSEASSPSLSNAMLAGSNKSANNGGLSAKAASAAVFVPKTQPSAAASTDGAIAEQAAALSLSSAARAAVFNPSGGGGSTVEAGRDTPTSFADEAIDVFDPTYTGPLPPDVGAQQAPAQAPAPPPPQAAALNPYEGDYGEWNQQAAAAQVKLRQPLQYHQYAPPLPHVSNLHPHHLTSHAFFLHPNQREELQRKQEAMFTNVPPPELGGPNLPEELHVYHSLVPLEPMPPSAAAGGTGGGPGFPLNPALLDPTLDPSAIGTTPSGAPGIMGSSGDPSKLFGYRSHSYKAVCSLDGKSYVLRRLEGFKLQHEVAIGLVERWRRIRHPSIVSVREAFTTRAFGDQSIVFVYDYHPLASTLHAEHMVPKPPQQDRRTGRLTAVPMQVPEKTLWSYTCQLANALRCIHKAGLSARSIEPSKILHTGQNRVRINCCSIFDVIAYDARAPASAIATQQADDLLNLGRLILCTACNSATASNNVAASLDELARVYSPELKSMILWLLQKPHQNKDADELVRLLAGRMADEFDSALNYNDSLESSLLRELENARLLRLLCKLGFINERPEFDHDPRWSETGDRYVVKLFRDHVFHSVNESGRPLVDLSHILTNLNKLDAGSEEKLMLTSRDEQSCIIASYRDIKNCIESAFQDLSRG